MELDDYYVAESYRELETVGGVYEEDDKTYIKVILKSGKIKAVRAYPVKQDKQVTAKTTYIVYDLHNELGFYPKGFVYCVRCPDESALTGLVHWDRRLGAYMKCTEDPTELPLGQSIKIVQVHWWDICADDIIHLRSDDEVRMVINNKFANLKS